MVIAYVMIMRLANDDSLANLICQCGYMRLVTVIVLWSYRISSAS